MKAWALDIPARIVGGAWRAMLWLLAGLLPLCAVGLVVLFWAVPLPDAMLLGPPASPVVVDVDGQALLALVGPDDQWRIEVDLDAVCPHLIRAVLAVEDARFFAHEGVDPLAVARAVGQNIAARSRLSGASTLTMQVCRLLDPAPRTWRAKVVESVRAMRLEQRWSKGRILRAWLNLAPMGGNLVGVEAASRAYFGKTAGQLSLAEAALVAGLPQSPARYRPDRYPARARRRQRIVLDRMLDLGWIDPGQHAEAVAQPIHIRRAANIRGAWHASWMALARRPGGGRLCIDLDLQQQVAQVLTRRRADWPAGTQAAVVVIDVRSAGLVALVGSLDPDDPAGGRNNFAAAWRSPGSALKPFVYATAMEAGRLAPESTVYDVPIVRAGWEPENFDHEFRGAVPAGLALRDSLNIPAILVAEAVGIHRAAGLMTACGVRLPPDAAGRGQLATVTGAVETRLLDLTNAYATLARDGAYRPMRLFVDESAPPSQAMAPNVAATLNQVLSLAARTGRSGDGPWCMWKTGTSAGRRDAWAVGHNGRFAVGVWVGVVQGPGRAEYVGATAAEPVFLELMRHPMLRQDPAPAAPEPILVRRPIGRPVDTGRGPLRILRPAPAARYVSLDGRCVVHPLANRTEGLQWFLNGRRIEPERAGRLVLPPGQYELRVVDSAGRSAAAGFQVH